MNRPQPGAILLALIVLLLTGGCGWVDATGRQSGDEPGFTETPSFTVPALGSLESTPIALLERDPRDVTLSGTDTTLAGWTWRALEEREEPAFCDAVDGFDAALAERRLIDACSDASRCELDVEERAVDGTTVFSVELPALRAPVAARVSLTTRDAEGRQIERRRTLCGVSINEAPDAADDRLFVSPGETLVVRADDPSSLLANDTDDDDVRNTPLVIDPTPESEPRHASVFELGTDGSLMYRPADDLSLGDDGVLEDSFVYRLSDGLHEVTGNVVVVIAETNGAPFATDPLPDVEIAIDPSLPRVVRIELAPFFADPDGDELVFAVVPDSLPPGGGLFVNENGVLAGQVGPEDLGAYRVTLIVGDGRTTIEQDFLLEIVREFEANTKPTVTDIDNRVFNGRFRYDVSPFFDDADGDTLIFGAVGLPAGVEIDRQGVISGRSQPDNRGAWFVVVFADDGRDGVVSDGFRLTIR